MKNAIIVDDEQPAIDKLHKMLDATGKVKTIKTFTDPMAVSAFVTGNHVDIIFLDIEMPGMDGLKLANQLLEIKSTVHIIFVTAYNEYAVEAFRIHALDYLMKPVEAERLNIALNRVPDLKLQLESEIDIKINCFEKFKVFIQGEEIKFRTAKAEEMLALLICYDGREIHRNTIMDLFWPDYDGDRAIILFNTTLHYLKKAFLFYGVQLNIKYNRGAYSLQLPGVFCDFYYFKTRFEELMPVSKDNIEDCQELAELYTGNFLEHNDYTWSGQIKTKLKEKYLILIMEIAKYYQIAGQPQKSIDFLQKGLFFDPLNKSLNYRLLKALRNNRDKVAMLKYYEIYKAGLSSEFGIEPDEEIKNLIV